MRVALTGGVGSGKSTVLSFFRKKGALTLDADQIVHRAFKKQTVINKICRFMGRGLVINRREVDKKKLAALIFSSPVARKKLEAILHPIVRREMKSQMAKNKNRIAVCDVPLLFETGWNKNFDKVIVVDAPLVTRLKRLQAKGWTLADAKRRIRAQWPLARKVKKADFVVKNNSSLKNTKSQVDLIWNQLRGLHGISARTTTAAK